MNKSKIIGDIKVREEDRQAREKQILNEISGDVNKSTMMTSESLYKHLVKFVRKMLLLTVSDAQQQRIAK